MGRVEGKVAIVTGGASGLGAATALRLGREGAKVVVTDLQEEAGEDVAGSIRNAGGEAIFLKHDVTDEAQWEAVVAETVKTYGGLDILFNNAGIAVSGLVEELTLEDWHRQQAVNQDGVFLGLKHSIPAMRASGGGSIINTSSVAGLRGAPNLGAYNASKGSVRLLTKAAAIEHAADNIRINSLHPGWIETPIWMQASDNPEEARAMVEQHIALHVPMNRAGKPDEIANIVLFLASDEASYMTGSEIVVDGGMTSGM